MLVRQRPFTRYFCHCGICQQVYGQAFGEPAVLWRAALRVEDETAIRYERRRLAPFSVRCGTCRRCAAPVAGFSALLPGLDLALVPAARFAEPERLPPAAGHLFYASRAQDIDDELPRYHGFLASELGFARFVLAGARASRRRSRELRGLPGAAPEPERAQEHVLHIDD